MSGWSLGVKLQIFQLWCKTIKSGRFLSRATLHFLPLPSFPWFSQHLKLVGHAAWISAENLSLPLDNPAIPQQEVKQQRDALLPSVQPRWRFHTVWRGQLLLGWQWNIYPRTYFHKQNVIIVIPRIGFPASPREQRRKELQLLQHRVFFEDRANKSSGLWQTALHRILVLFSPFHMTSQSWSPPHPPSFQDYISLRLIISFQVRTMKDDDAAAARTAGSVPSKIFLLMRLTCTSVYASASQLSRHLWF